MREGNKLTALKVAKLVKEGKTGWEPDGHGLYLKNGASWVFRYMQWRKARWMGLGPVNTVSLAEARIRARQARQILLEGKDPLAVRNESVTTAILEAHKTITFEQATIEFLKTSKIEGFKNAKHRKQWTSTLESYAFPVIGDMPLTKIDTALVLKTIMPVWERTPETGSRLRGRIERVFDWAKPLGYFAGDNPAQWQLLKDHLPKRSKAKDHHAVPVSEIGAFMVKLRERDSLSSKALEFTILTASRTNETIGMRWDEIDFAHKVWTIPASRMKADREHRAPLSDRALAVLASVPRNGSALVFPLSNMAMLELLKGMNGDGYTVHGFRSTFSDWARDCAAYARDVIEMALAHQIKDKSEAAYRRGDATEKWARLMTEWAKFCEAPAISATVTPINKHG
jgi:integrase